MFSNLVRVSNKQSRFMIAHGMADNFYAGIGTAFVTAASCNSHESASGINHNYKVNIERSRI